jgi:5-methylthioadenosine/S-adenosylhomocysteine deaminase
MAPEHGAATTPFAGRIGISDPGTAVDLVLLDWHRSAHPYLDAGTSVLDAVVHRGRAAGVAAVLVGGEVIRRDAGFCSSRGPCGLGRARLDHQERT